MFPDDWNPYKAVSVEETPAMHPEVEPTSGVYYSCYVCGRQPDMNEQLTRKKYNNYVLSFCVNCLHVIKP